MEFLLSLQGDLAQPSEKSWGIHPPCFKSQDTIEFKLKFLFNQIRENEKFSYKEGYIGKRNYG